MKLATRILPLVLFAGLAAYMLYPRPGGPELHCTFDLEPSEYAKTALPRHMVVYGALSDATDGAESLQGRAEWELGGKPVNARAWGAVFQDQLRATTGLFLTVDTQDPEGLRIATLNTEGQLDENGSKAFFYRRNQADKQAFPLKYTCVRTAS